MTNDRSGDRLLTVAETAARLGVCARQVFNLTAAKRMPAAVRLGRSTRWRASDLDRFIASGCDMLAFDAAREGVIA